MSDTVNSDTATAHRFLLARKQFAFHKSNFQAAKLLRAANEAYSEDLIDDEEQEGVLFDVIEYLESEQD